MEEKIKKVLENINTNIMGVTFDVNGRTISFSHNKKKGTYTMTTDGKEQEGFSLNELLVLLNRPALKEAIEKQYAESMAEEGHIKEIRKRFFAEIDKMKIPESEKNILRMIVRQITIQYQFFQPP